jgi:superfamily I DNA/RNA helicase
MTDILQKLKESKKKLFVGIAGPGTGKSTTFKTIVDSDEFKGKKILILSFINKLVDDLSNDFKDFDNVTVSTLHSFAKKQIGDVDLEQSLDKIISEDYLFIKGGNIDFEEKFHRNNISNDEEVFYKERKDFYKHEKSLYSLNSIIYAVYKLFEKFEDKIPNEYDLILIDEFQDFNELEYKFIQFLNKKSRLVLVGDDNQSLYFFKKAEPKLIRELYKANHTEGFSLDYCFRCTEVIVNAVNDLINNVKKQGYLKDGLDKKFLYPTINEEKNRLSREFPKINFIPAVSGDLLIYKIEQDIKNNIKGKSKKRILILVPSYLKQTIYDGLIKKGFNVVEFELFYDEKHNELKHKYIVEIFKVLSKRKTDNLALRKILSLYLTNDEIKGLIVGNKEAGKKIWSLLSNEVRERIEADIGIINKAQKGKLHLSESELIRFSKIFALKNLLSRMIKGFAPVEKNAIEIELVTVTSSKGLSAEYVYYVGIDNKILLDKETNDFTDQSICEFLVGITRAKEKLTLISLEDDNPKILDFVNQERISRVEE